MTDIGILLFYPPQFIFSYNKNIMYANKALIHDCWWGRDTIDCAIKMEWWIRVMRKTVTTVQVKWNEVELDPDWGEERVVVRFPLIIDLDRFLHCLVRKLTLTGSLCSILYTANSPSGTNIGVSYIYVYILSRDDSKACNKILYALIGTWSDTDLYVFIVNIIVFWYLCHHRREKIHYFL